VEYVDKVVKTNACTFQQAAQTVFTAKVSGTFSRFDSCFLSSLLWPIIEHLYLRRVSRINELNCKCAAL
jgi:hypothetical protein